MSASRLSASGPSAAPSSRSSAEVSEPGIDDVGCNLVVLRGRVSAAPVLRVLPSGSRLVTLAVRVPTGEGSRTSVPVACWDPATWVEAVDAGDELVVTGTVRRRFFRTGGATGSRVEVRAVAIGRAGDRRRRDALARRARAELATLD